MRFLPHTNDDRAAMLKTVGAKSIDDLYAMVPANAQRKGLVDLPLSMSEREVERRISAYAANNHTAQDGPFFLGAGCYYHHIPSTVDMVIQRSEFLTAYTPYQPEISQGTLGVIFQFQSMIASLTGQEIANASMYDGATAVAEAALMTRRLTGRSKIMVATPLHPHYRELLETYWAGTDGSIVDGHEPDEETACLIVQTPDFLGTPHSLAQYRAACDKTGAKLVVAITEILSLGLLPAPAEADIVAGEGQSLGVPMGFGGPHVGFFASKAAYTRQMPGRLCGLTEDADGKPGFVLTLSTREQHIRREKATSNICSNQGLMALAFTVHLSLLGEGGFKRLARLNHAKACQLAEALEKTNGILVENKTFFNEFVIKTPVADSKALVEQLAFEGIVAGYPLSEGRVLVAATEMTEDNDIESLCAALGRL